MIKRVFLDKEGKVFGSRYLTPPSQHPSTRTDKEGQVYQGYDPIENIELYCPMTPDEIEAKGQLQPSSVVAHNQKMRSLAEEAFAPRFSLEQSDTSPALPDAALTPRSTVPGNENAAAIANAKPNLAVSGQGPQSLVKRPKYIENPLLDNTSPGLSEVTAPVFTPYPVGNRPIQLGPSASEIHPMVPLAVRGSSGPMPIPTFRPRPMFPVIGGPVTFHEEGVAPSGVPGGGAIDLGSESGSRSVSLHRNTGLRWPKIRWGSSHRKQGDSKQPAPKAVAAPINMPEVVSSSPTVKQPIDVPFKANKTDKGNVPFVYTNPVRNGVVNPDQYRLSSGKDFGLSHRSSPQRFYPWNLKIVSEDQPKSSVGHVQPKSVVASSTRTPSKPSATMPVFSFGIVNKVTPKQNLRDTKDTWQQDLQDPKVQAYISKFISNPARKSPSEPLKMLATLLNTPEEKWDSQLTGYSDDGNRTLKSLAYLYLLSNAQQLNELQKQSREDINKWVTPRTGNRVLDAIAIALRSGNSIETTTGDILPHRSVDAAMEYMNRGPQASRTGRTIHQSASGPFGIPGMHIAETAFLAQNRGGFLPAFERDLFSLLTPSSLVLMGLGSAGRFGQLLNLALLGPGLMGTASEVYSAYLKKDYGAVAGHIAAAGVPILAHQLGRVAIAKVLKTPTPGTGLVPRADTEPTLKEAFFEAGRQRGFTIQQTKVLYAEFVRWLKAYETAYKQKYPSGRAAAEAAARYTASLTNKIGQIATKKLRSAWTKHALPSEDAEQYAQLKKYFFEEVERMGGNTKQAEILYKEFLKQKQVREHAARVRRAKSILQQGIQRITKRNAKKPSRIAYDRLDSPEARASEYAQLKVRFAKELQKMKPGSEVSLSVLEHVMQLIQFYCEHRSRGVKSYVDAFDFYALDNRTRGSFHLESGLMKFNKDVTDGLKLLFSNRVLTLDELYKGRNAIRTALHETGHAASSVPLNELEITDFYIDDHFWALNFNEGVTESWARQNIDHFADTLGITTRHPGFKMIELHPINTSYNKEAAGIHGLCAWMEQNYNVNAKQMIEVLRLHKTCITGPEYIADVIVSNDPRVQKLSHTGERGAKPELRLEALRQQLISAIKESFGNKDTLGANVVHEVQAVLEQELKNHD